MSSANVMGAERDLASLTMCCSLLRFRQDKFGGAWCPRSSIGPNVREWIEIDLRRPFRITRTGTQVSLVRIRICSPLTEPKQIGAQLWTQYVETVLCTRAST